MPDNYQPDDNLNNGGMGGGTSPRQPLSRGQKIAAGVLAVFAVLVIGLWFAQFKKSIISPLRTAGTGQELAQNENSDEALKNKDTDSDGLSDWDELNLYKTSPYLEDSDSDGFSDKEEINNGTDPNCPAGRQCFSADASAGETNQNTGSLLGTSSPDNLLSNQLNLQAGGQNQDTGLQNVLSGNSDAATLRKMLLDAGMDKAMLDKISDEDLIKSYQETLNSSKQ